MPVTDKDATVSANQAADILDVHVATVSRMIDRGDLPAKSTGKGHGRRHRVPLEAVLRVRAHEDVKASAYDAAATDLSEDMNALCEQAQRTRQLWREAFDHDSNESEAGAALEHFDEITAALDELEDRVRSAQASRRLLEQVFM